MASTRPLSFHLRRLRLCVCTSVVSARVCEGLGGPSRVQLTSHVEMKSTCTASTVALPLALEDIPSSEHHIVVAYAIAHRIPTPNNKCRQNERAPRVPRAGLVRGGAGGGRNAMRNARRLRRQTSTETSTETPRGDSAGNKSQGVVPGAFRLTLLGRSPAPPTGETGGLLSNLGGVVIRIRILCILHVSCMYFPCILM